MQTDLPTIDTLADLKIFSDRFLASADADWTGPDRFHAVVENIHGVLRRISAAEERGFGREAILSAAASAREVHARSPFVHRLQTWPRGYPGDFETIEYLLEQKVRAPIATMEFWIEYYALGTWIAQQHRNKVAAQANEVSRILDLRKPARILVIAAGSSPDLASVEHLLRTCDCSLVLNDADAGALAFSLNRLSAITDKVKTFKGNALTSCGKLALLGPFDLILAGGLFDYLPDRPAGMLIRAVWGRLLAPGGRFFFTNLGQRNPFRLWMQYMVDWSLIERAEVDIRQLVSVHCGPDAICSTETEASRLTWLVRVDRPANG